MTELTLDDIRMFLQDYAGLNILLDEEEFDNRILVKAVEYAVDMWKVIPPPVANHPGSIPKSILIKGAASWLIKSSSFLQMRNQATVSDGEVAPIGIDDKGPMYAQISRELLDQFKSEAQQYKIMKNMSAAYGSFGSGYKWTR